MLLYYSIIRRPLLHRKLILLYSAFINSVVRFKYKFIALQGNWFIIVYNYIYNLTNISV